MKARLTLALLLAGCSSMTVAATEEAGAPPAVTPYADLRYRLELVDQAGLARDATASTLRARGGLRSREWHGFAALVEGEATVRVGGEQYNDTVNGRTQYPVVADPEDAIVNQAWLRFKPNDRFALQAGRQAVNLDNQRWIGSVGWRQNDQTLDAAGVTVSPTKAVTFGWTHAWRVNRVFGTDSPQGTWRDNDIDLVRVAAELGRFGTLVGYGYLLDIPDAPAVSSQTFGARYSGSRAAGGKVKLLYALEYARQSDYGANPGGFALDYVLVEPGMAIGPATLKAGFEQLEGNGTVALQTPLATLHAFNGWADKYLSTPPNGLRDIYVDATWAFKGAGVLAGTTVRVARHEYRAEHVSARYGSEWNAQVARPFGKHVSALAKFASYDADTLATDTTKVWFAVEAKF